MINKNKADEMLGRIGIQPSERTSIISLASDTIAQTDKDVKIKLSLKKQQLILLLWQVKKLTTYCRCSCFSQQSMPDKSDSTAPIIEVVENYINIPQNDISVNKAMDDEYVNLVKSVYPLDNFALIIQEYTIKGKLIIINKNKADKMLAPIGIQPSQRSRIISLARDTIVQTNKYVNAYDVQELNKKYLAALKRGNIKAAQKLVDEAAKRAGYERKMFHETKAANIHIFDISRESNP